MEKTGEYPAHLMDDGRLVTAERVDEYVAPLLRPGAVAAAPETTML